VVWISCLSLLRFDLAQDVFEKSDQSETPVHRQKSAHPIWLKVRSRAGLALFRRKKINHAMKNHSPKISSISHEVKTPLDSNRKNISAKFQPPARSAAPHLC
jgi:hypothetical protein